MNLAVRDVRYHLFKFFSSTLGVSLLIMVVIAIGGIVRGVISDSFNDHRKDRRRSLDRSSIRRTPGGQDTRAFRGDVQTY
ncbi:hypothetical protein GGD68_007437 [Paraburkholderia fungorum]|uniref:Uncharacterized protein n=1 Tax=Paraburkholderia fungorum TaxID=134537 RepID=A0AAW3UZM1_9BURK|nr:hypothetical protein [Paraburkholderia fungorum]MBB6204114.1 hypothetical protein [Paraburkholderia fungorum]